MKSVLLFVKNMDKTSKVFALVERDKKKKKALVLARSTLVWIY